MSKDEIVQEVDILSTIRGIGKRSKKLQAVILQELEKHVNKTSPEFDTLRKFVLDEVNNYTRSIVRDIFGDIEFLIKG
jgi:hypothetical protein